MVHHTSTTKGDWEFFYAFDNLPLLLVKASYPDAKPVPQRAKRIAKTLCGIVADFVGTDVSSVSLYSADLTDSGAQGIYLDGLFPSIVIDRFVSTYPPGTAGIYIDTLQDRAINHTEKIRIVLAHEYGHHVFQVQSGTTFTGLPNQTFLSLTEAYAIWFSEQITRLPAWEGVDQYAHLDASLLAVAYEFLQHHTSHYGPRFVANNAPTLFERHAEQFGLTRVGGEVLAHAAMPKTPA